MSDTSLTELSQLTHLDDAGLAERIGGYPFWNVIWV